MAMTLGDIVVNIKSDTSQLTKGFKRAESVVSKSAKTMNNAIKILTAGFISLSVVDLAKSLGRQADAMTNVDSKLKLVTKSTEDLISTQTELFKIAQDTRTSYTDNVDLFQRMAMSTKELNLSQEEMLSLTDSINKSMIISGTTAAGASSLITQLGQAFSANFQAVSQEINSLKDQAPSLYQALLVGTGKTAAEFKKMAEAGELSSELIINAITKQKDAIDEDFSKMALTIDQAQTRVSNATLMMIGNFDKLTGASSFVAESINDISKSIQGITSENIEETTKQIKVAAITIVTMTVAIKGYTAASALATTANVLLGGSYGAVNRAILLTTISTKALSFAMKTIPLVAVAGAISLIAYAWLEADKAQTEYKKTAEELSTSDLMAGNRARVEQLNKLIESGRFGAKTIDMWKDAIKRLNAEYDILKSKIIDPSDIVTGAGGEFNITLTGDEAEDFNKAGLEFAKENADELIAYNKKVSTDFLSWQQKAKEKNIETDTKNAELFEAQRQKAFEDSLKIEQTASQKMWENVGDIAKNNIAGALQAGMDGELDMTKFTSQIAKSIGQAMLMSGTPMGIVGGLGIMAIGSLIGGGDTKSAEEQAEDRVSDFNDELNDATKSLEAFGLSGEAMAVRLDSVLAEIQTTGQATTALEAQRAKFGDGAVGKAFDELIKSSTVETELLNEQLADYNLQIDAQTKNLNDELAILKETDPLKKKELERQLEYDSALSDTNVAIMKQINAEQDRQDVIEKSTKLQADIAKQVNAEMLGSLSYLSDIEKLSYANNLYRTAITPEDRISSSRAIAEVSRGTTRTREDYIPIFEQYINELEKQGEEATLTDVVNKLDEVVTSIDAQTDSATEDAVYGT